MSKVVAVHGVGQQFRGSAVLEDIWLPSMRDGLLQAGYPRIDDVSLTCAFYGDLFRDPSKPPRGKKGPPGGAPGGGNGLRQVESRRPLYQSHHATGQTDDLERELLKAWYQHSAELDQGKAKPASSGRSHSRSFLVKIYAQFFGSPLWTTILARSLIGDASQISTYMLDPAIRVAARVRLVDAIGPDTRVIVGHSLGAVVAYETLCLYPGLPVRAFVTLGSPLGIKNLIFDRLEPEPENDVGRWPSDIRFWHNIVDPSDIIALGEPLRPLFGPKVTDHFVDNGNRPHDLGRYLSSPETGYSIISGLQE